MTFDITSVKEELEDVYRVFLFIQCYKTHWTNKCRHTRTGLIKATAEISFCRIVQARFEEIPDS